MLETQTKIACLKEMQKICRGQVVYGIYVVLSGFTQYLITVVDFRVQYIIYGEQRLISVAVVQFLLRAKCLEAL